MPKYLCGPEPLKVSGQRLRPGQEVTVPKDKAEPLLAHGLLLPVPGAPAAKPGTSAGTDTGAGSEPDTGTGTGTGSLLG